MREKLRSDELKIQKITLFFGLSHYCVDSIVSPPNTPPAWSAPTVVYRAAFSLLSKSGIVLISQEQFR